MKSLIYFLAVLLSINTIYAKTLIVTDVDDTVKITDVLNKRNAVFNALFSKAAFSGMSELFRKLETPDSTLYYISGSPKFLSEKVTSFLEYNNFPQRENLILKKSLSYPTYDYKIAAIRTIIQKINPDEVILIGDDTEFDPEVYSVIANDYPSKVDAIYIRAIQNRKLPQMDKLKNFFSAVEIAGLEMLRGNLDSRSLVDVATSFVKGGNDSKLFINGRYCPPEGREQIDELIQLVTEQSEINALELAQQKIITTCR